VQEDEEECGFCLFMKAGPCGKRFAAWEACVDDAESAGINIVEKCAQKTHYLKDCMEANPEYYGPVLQAEKAIDEQTAMEASKTGGEDNPSNVQSIPA
jgi:intermembrane space import and assembly protein 40